MKIKETICIINRGGFGVIDKVRLKDRSIVARKTFSPINSDSLDDKVLSKYRQRFVREVRTQEKLPEHLFMPILYSNLEGDNPWFLMPVAERVYSQEIKLSGDNSVLDGLADILNSLETLHELGLVHRDLKPQNVLKHDGQWKLADLGLISADSNLSVTLTSTDSFAGTQLYCAPEQLTDFKSVTRHADIYSFGAILHDIFDGGNRIPYRRQTTDGPIGFVIEKCTEEKVQDRFDNVTSLRKALLSVLAKDKEKERRESNSNEWSQKLVDIDKWKSKDAEALLIYLKRNSDEVESVFLEFNNEIISRLNELSPQLWKDICLMYFEWVSETGFDFNYCDLLVGYILKMYDATEDLELKSKAVIATAELAVSHNRWYVMGKVFRMAGIRINDMLARRISIEIHANGERVKSNFIVCASRIGKSESDYHSFISEVLTEDS